MLKSWSAQALYDKILSKSASVGVVGLGYVGLPLVDAIHSAGFDVLGLDIDELKVGQLNEGTSYLTHIDDTVVGSLTSSDRFEATSEYSRLSTSDIIIMCVPTPLTKNNSPDLYYIETTVKNIAPHLRDGCLIVLESTTYPGTTVDIVVPRCEQLSSMRSQKSLFFAYSPEREDPGNVHFATRDIPKVVGGVGSDASLLAESFYASVFDSVVPVSNTNTAEAVKLMENIFRSVNIALVNELKIVFQKMNIDIWEVIDAAKTKPFGYMPFYPGPGLGGHCVPIDPFYLAWKAKEFGVSSRFIELAGEINTQMPSYVVATCVKALNVSGKAVKNSAVLCIGLSYKRDISDYRESPTFVVMDLLQEMGAHVSYFDPLIPEIGDTRDHAVWAGEKSVEWSEESISRFDLAVILTDHTAINYAELFDWLDQIVDSRNAIFRHTGKVSTHVWRA